MMGTMFEKHATSREVCISDKYSFVYIFYEFEFLNLNIEASSIVNARKILNIPPREVLVKSKDVFYAETNNCFKSFIHN